jgi:PKD repeat protein
MKTFSRRPSVITLAVAGLFASLVLTTTTDADAGIPVYIAPSLSLARSIRTSPFVGTTTSPSDAEGLAYVPQDNSIWLADDNGHRVFEIDKDTGVLKNTITRAQLAAAVRVGGTDTAGNNTASDFEALAYDATTDSLYVFAGRCCNSSIRAAAFKLVRSGNTFQVSSFQPFTYPLNDFSGVGSVNGELWAALGKVLYKYTYATNTFTNPYTVSGISGSITGLGFSPDGQDLWFVTSGDVLRRMRWATRTLLASHNFALTPFGVRDSRAVEVVGDQLFICDGYDSYPSGSADRYAIKVYNVFETAIPAPTASFTTDVTTGTAPLAVQFTDTSAGVPTSWSWNFGDGSPTSTQQSPAHSFATAGTYTVTLTASNGAGGTSASTTITAAAAPVAPTTSFTSSVTSGTVPLAVQFTDTSTGAPTAWNWDFGDGSPTSTEQNPPLHTFATAGTYNVTLTASNAVGPGATASTTITAIAPVAPTTSFTSSVTSGTVPLAVQFTDTSTGAPTAWNWDFGDGSPTSTEQNPPLHTFATAGTYNVTLTASNAVGPGTTASTTITANAEPPPPVTTTFAVTADSIISSTSPTKNYGTYDYIRALAPLNGSTEYRPFVRFDVSGVTGTVTHAVMRLYVTDGTTNAGAWYTTAASWSETTINWANAPAPTGGAVASTGAVNAGTWIEVDVTSAVSGNGPISITAIPVSTNSVRYGSKESTTAPQLVVTWTPA